MPERFHSLGARPFAAPAPVFLVGSYGADRRPDIMPAAWAGIVASQPPCLGVSLTGARLTHANITGRRAFTVGIPPAALVAEVDFAGLHSGRDTDKFAELGLTPVPAEHVDAPFVAECPAVLELRLVRTVELGSHTLFIGEIMDVKVHERCLNARGLPDMALLDPLLYIPLSREYWTVGAFAAKAFSVGHSKGAKALL